MNDFSEKEHQTDDITIIIAKKTAESTRTISPEKHPATDKPQVLTMHNPASIPSSVIKPSANMLRKNRKKK